MTGPHCNNAAEGGGKVKGVLGGGFGHWTSPAGGIEEVGPFKKSEVWGGFEILDFLALGALFRAGGADAT